MAREPQRPFRFGGISLVVSGALFLLKVPLDLAAGPPPSSGREILAWMTAARLPLSLVNELLFVAGMFLIPGAIALHAGLARIDRTRAAAGAGVLAAAIPMLFVTVVVHGRLVYPVYGIRLGDPAVAEFVVAAYHGGMHALGITLAVATLVLSLALRRGALGPGVAQLGFVAAVFDVVGAYPWLVGTPLVVASQVVPAAWLIAVGAKLHAHEPAGRAGRGGLRRPTG